MARLLAVGGAADLQIGFGCLAVFAAMSFYFVAARRLAQGQHRADFLLASGFALAALALDAACVRYLPPLAAMAVGSAAVMTLILVASRLGWLRRFFGLFIPLFFLSCGVLHLLEGIADWHLPSGWSVTWAMLTADLAFAVLVNSARFPLLIRGQEIDAELTKAQADHVTQQKLFSDVLYAASDGKLTFHADAADLPPALPELGREPRLTRENLADARGLVAAAAAHAGFDDDRKSVLLTASGEAMMNAVVHGGGGEMRVGAVPGQVQVRVHDRGHGIPLHDLPRALLQKGWSTRGTMGIGFPLILSSADRVDMTTGADGTNVVVTMDAAPRLQIPESYAQQLNQG